MEQPTAAGVPNPGADKFSDRKTTNIRLEGDLKKEAIKKAGKLEIPLCEYVEKLIRADLGV